MLAALLLALPSAALAQQWVEYARDVRGAVNFYDPASLERDGSVVRVSVRRDFSGDPSQPQRIAEEIWFYDCAGTTAGWMSFTTYSASGEVMEQRSLARADVEFGPLTPGSTGYRLFETLCRR